MPEPIDVLRALAHPVRWGILERLAAEPGICACDFTEFFDVSQPTISAHLKTLREAELVTAQRRGTTICYTLEPGQLALIAARLHEIAATAASGAPTSGAPTSGPPSGAIRPRPMRPRAMPPRARSSSEAASDG